VTNRIIPYEKDLKKKARELRKDSTLTEVLLWNELRGRKLKGYQFHRQIPMLKYIVDFYCHELRLAIEVDGPSHDSKEKYDSKRQYELEQWDVNLIRFSDSAIKHKMDTVLNSISGEIERIENEK
jgi:very-short-patch-repair endonuclease